MSRRPVCERQGPRVKVAPSPAIEKPPMTLSTSQLLVQHAYATLTGSLRKNRQTLDPAGPFSWWLRQFDVRLGKPAAAGAQVADGWVEGRTLWLAPSVVQGWLSRHHAARERRQNGWLRLSEAAEAMLIELAAVAVRGQPLDNHDRFALKQALGQYHLTRGVGLELAKGHDIQVLTPASFYDGGNAAHVVATQRRFAADTWGPFLMGLLETAWNARGLPLQETETLRPPSCLPQEDLTIVDRARWVQYVENVVSQRVDTWADSSALAQDMRQGFADLVLPLTRVPSPAFLYERLAHHYRDALLAAGFRLQKVEGWDKVFSSDGSLLADFRFSLVLAALDVIETAGASQPGYEEALMAGWVNVERVAPAID